MRKSNLLGLLLISILISGCFEDPNELVLDINPFDSDYPHSFGQIENLYEDQNSNGLIRIDYRINPDVIADIDQLTELDFEELYFAFEVYASEDVSSDPLFLDSNPFIDRHIRNPIKYSTIDVDRTYSTSFTVNSSRDEVCISFLLRRGEQLINGDRTPPKINACLEL